jgi:S-adenosylmethionine:tRNA-ribosyltransferase-isomerase (queuine synthetase)
MLVSALAGRPKILRAYQIAIKQKYRFFFFWRRYVYPLSG